MSNPARSPKPPGGATPEKINCASPASGYPRLVDACKERGQVGAILRREGIYYSTLRDFQEQRAQGRLEPGYERDRQTAITEQAADKMRIAELEALNRQLQQRLQQAEIVIDVQKKLSQLLGISLPQTEPMREESR